VRFQRDLLRLLTNYVNFAEFYQRRGAIFQVGDLYLDAPRVPPVHRSSRRGEPRLAGGPRRHVSGLLRPAPPNGERKTIVAAFTDGDSDNLMVGRNGIFYDSKGNDWDATITKIISNPISIREAFWSPYKKLQRMIEEMVAKRAATADSSSNEKLSGAAEAATTADKPRPVEAQLPKKMDIGTVAALAVAFSAIGATLSALATGLMGLDWWQCRSSLSA